MTKLCSNFFYCTPDFIM
uniref:Uncharacterized protein n=1 Tax=Arundo donax TaxID=35708 RepID=A0A0A8Z0C4_ARUDO